MTTTIVIQRPETIGSRGGLATSQVQLQFAKEKKITAAMESASCLVVWGKHGAGGCIQRAMAFKHV